MASALTKVIGEVENVVGKGSVCAVVTDNASNMCKSWELLMEKMPALTCNGCAAHTLNLVLKDMFGIKYLGDVLKSAVSVTKFVRKRPALLYHFREVQRRQMGLHQHRRALVIPVSTRWYSSTNCISSLVHNEEVLREVFANEALLDRYKNAEAKLNRAKTILADSSFWMKARSVLRLVQPVVKALGAVEKDGCCLSMVYHYFREMRFHRVFCAPNDDVEQVVLSNIKAILQKRWKSIKRESVLAAFLLDPSKSPDDFDGNDLDSAVTACVELVSRVGLSPGVTEVNFRDAIMKFIRAKDRWSQEQWEQASSYTPLDWWRLKSADVVVLRAFAERVLSIPTSSAASERSWSVHSFIHNKRRNRLKPARVEKLAFLYTNVGDKTSTGQVHYKEYDDTVIDQERLNYFSTVSESMNAGKFR
jgi:hypothetical protein